MHRSTIITIILIVLIAVIALPLAGFFRPAEASAPKPEITLQPPIDYPMSIDGLYAKIEAKEYGWNYADKPTIAYPFFSWQQVKLIERLMLDDKNTGMVIIPAKDLALVLAIGGVKFPTEGTLRISEQELFAYAAFQVFEGDMLLCGNNGGYPVEYGEGVQALFDRIAGKVE